MRVLNEKRLKERIRTTVLADIESGRVGGVAVAVTQNGKTVYQDCFGDERIGIHVSENTLFRMASMTKPITVAAILMLVDRGMLELDTPIADFLPSFRKMYIGRMGKDVPQCVEPAKTLITIRHLLTHSGGLGSGPVGDYIYAKLSAKERICLNRVVEYYAENPLDFEPYTSQCYSGIHGFDVLARIVEVVSGMDYDKFLEKELFSPLEMVDTTFAPTAQQWSRMIPMHIYKNGVGMVADFPQNSVFEGFPTTCFAGGAGLASTLQDYKKFAAMLLDYGKFEGGQLISEKMIQEMAAPQLPAFLMKGQEVWGLGVRVITEETYADLPCGTFGWSGAYGTHFWVDPVNEITAVYLKNSLYDGGSGASTARRFEQDVNGALE